MVPVALLQTPPAARIQVRESKATQTILVSTLRKAGRVSAHVDTRPAFRLYLSSAFVAIVPLPIAQPIAPNERESTLRPCPEPANPV